jgi:hypothetical protein
LRLTGKSNVQLVVFRSAVSVGQSPVLYRASSPIPNPNTPLTNSVLVDSLQFIDVTPDSLLTQNLELYASGSDPDLPAFAAPALSFVYPHRLRVFGISSENKNVICPSQTYIPNSGVSPSFHPNLNINVDPAGGDVTALCTMDERLIIFEENQVLFTVGDGPGPDGSTTNSYFSPPDLITTDVGCIASGSVVQAPMGIMFQSAKGIYLLDRKLEASYIGAPVEDLIQGNTVLSANLMPDRNEIRFALNNGTTVVYNYFFDMWYEFLNWWGPATIWNGTYVFFNPSALGGGGAGILQETPGVFTDGDGAIISSTLELYWARWAGPQGYQRVRSFSFLGTFQSNHTMQVTITYDYQADGVQDIILWNATEACNPSQYGNSNYGAMSPYGDPILGVYQCRGFPGIQLCESIKLTFQDTQLGAGGAGYSLEDLTFEVGLEKGTMRLPAGPGGHQAG